MFLDVISVPDHRRMDQLQYLYISLGNLCNASCAYCDVHESPPAVRPYGKPELRQLFTSAVRLGCRTVHFLGGGEPLIAPQLPAALELCGELGLGVVVTTNGSHIARRLVPWLDRVTVEAVIVSLDSDAPRIHDEIRGIPRLWSLAVAGVRDCRAATSPPKIIVNHVLTRNNIAGLPGFIAFAGSIGADAINLIAVKDRRLLRASVEQLRALARDLAGMRELAASVGTRLLCLDQDVAVWSARGGAPVDREYLCMFPRFAVYIDLATGGVFPCDCTVHRAPRSTFDLGDIWSQSLDDIWNGEPMRRIRGVLETSCDPGCKRECDWNNMRTNAYFTLGRTTNRHA